MDIAEREVDVGPVQLPVQRLDSLLYPPPVPGGIVVVQGEVAQQHEVGVVGVTLGLEPAHYPIDQGVELLAPVVDVVPEVEMGVDGHELIGPSAWMPGYAERDAEGLTDEGQEDAQLEPRLGLAPPRFGSRLSLFE